MMKVVAKSEDPDSGMTPEENEVMNSLVAAWNLFTALPNNRADAHGDFCRSIHECQRIIAQRVVARRFPNYWR